MTATLTHLSEKETERSAIAIQKEPTNGISKTSEAASVAAERSGFGKVSNFAQRLSFKLVHVDCVAAAAFGTY